MQTTVARRREPRLEQKMWTGLSPDWWHHHGCKLQIANFVPQNRLLILEGSAARLQVMRAGSAENDGWYIEWEVRQAQMIQVIGRTRMSSVSLAAAFGLSDETEYLEQWLIDRYGGDAARQGQFIRWRDFLNIPCPGIGHDGDPNISVYLTDDIKVSVAKLLK